MKPICYDLCCGSGGWAQGFIEEGYRVIGYDIQPQPLYPGELRILDVCDVSGVAMRDGAVIVASPPCQEFSRWDMPWTRARNPPLPDLSIVEACWRIAKEAELPIILENVRAAQNFIGRSRFRLQGFHLWGDIPALMGSFPAPRKKESMSSTAQLPRARVPIELARWIAKCFYPVHLNRPTQASDSPKPGT